MANTVPNRYPTNAASNQRRFPLPTTAMNRAATTANPDRKAARRSIGGARTRFLQVVAVTWWFYAVGICRPVLFRP